MSDEKLEFNLPPVPSGLLNSETSQDEAEQDEDSPDEAQLADAGQASAVQAAAVQAGSDNSEVEPTTFQPPPPPESFASPGASSPENYRAPAYSDEQTFFPPPPAPASQPPAVPSSNNASGSSSGASPATTPATSPATIDPLLQYRGQEEDYYQQEDPAPRSYSRRPRRHSAGRPSARFWIQFAIMLGVIILAVVMLRVFVFESFYITSDSMAPSLDSGDRILVNKLSSGRAGRGNLVVFSRPANDSTESDDDLVKRVVALEGETITLAQGRVFIGDQLLLEPYLEDDQTTRVAPGSRLFDACVNQVSPRSCTVAPGYVYVLGDNRSFSYDSRFFGPIPKSSIVGRAFWRVWPIGDFGGI